MSRANMSHRATEAPEPIPQYNRGLDVIIVGAGLGGLTLGIILERMNINYKILERGPRSQPQGSAMALNCNIYPALQQLGLWHDIKSISKAILRLELFDGKVKPISEIRHLGTVVDDEPIVFARADLFELLVAEIPPEKILWNKKVITVIQGNNWAKVTCTDKSAFHADVVVGADGAYSAVRQNVYKDLMKTAEFPEGDKEDLALGYQMMVGATSPLDPAKYPALRDERGYFRQMIGGHNLSWFVVTLPNNRFSWACTRQITSAKAAAALKFSLTEWSVEPNDAMVADFQDFPTGFGGDLGQFFDETPDERMSTMFVEEKLFETWHHGRSVLMGDACHKMMPSAGQGVVNAMLDAVVLANCLYEIQDDIRYESIIGAFESYRSQRYSEAKLQCDNSQFITQLMTGQKWTEKLLRGVVFRLLPDKIQTRAFEKQAAYRPQIVCLPRVEFSVRT